MTSLLCPTVFAALCSCAQVYRRFTKSLDTTKRCCGLCRCPLNYLGKFSADGTERKARSGNPYSAFVQENFAAVKAAQGPATPHREVMKELSNRWRQRGLSQIEGSGVQP